MNPSSAKHLFMLTCRIFRKASVAEGNTCSNREMNRDANRTPNVHRLLFLRRYSFNC